MLIMEKVVVYQCQYCQRHFPAHKDLTKHKGDAHGTLENKTVESQSFFSEMVASSPVGKRGTKAVRQGQSSSKTSHSSRIKFGNVGGSCAKSDSCSPSSPSITDLPVISPGQNPRIHGTAPIMQSLKEKSEDKDSAYAGSDCDTSSISPCRDDTYDLDAVYSNIEAELREMDLESSPPKKRGMDEVSVSLGGSIETYLKSSCDVQSYLKVVNKETIVMELPKEVSKTTTKDWKYVPGPFSDVSEPDDVDPGQPNDQRDIVSPPGTGSESQGQVWNGVEPSSSTELFKLPIGGIPPSASASPVAPSPIPTPPTPENTKTPTGEPRPLHCPICPVEFDNPQHFTAHCHEVHAYGNGTDYDCLLVDGEPLDKVCLFCLKKFTKIRFLLTHLKRMHPGFQTYMCDQCRFSTRSHLNMITHQKCHSANLRFCCVRCNASFYQRRMRDKHQFEMHDYGNRDGPNFQVEGQCHQDRPKKRRGRPRQSIRSNSSGSDTEPLVSDNEASTAKKSKVSEDTDSGVPVSSDVTKTTSSRRRTSLRYKCDTCNFESPEELEATTHMQTCSGASTQPVSRPSVIVSVRSVAMVQNAEIKNSEDKEKHERNNTETVEKLDVQTHALDLSKTSLERRPHSSGSLTPPCPIDVITLSSDDEDASPLDLSVTKYPVVDLCDSPKEVAAQEEVALTGDLENGEEPVVIRRPIAMEPLSLITLLPSRNYQCPYCFNCRTPFPAVLKSHVKEKHTNYFQIFQKMMEDKSKFQVQAGTELE